MASAVREGRVGGSQCESLEMNSCPCKVRTADAPRVAGRCPTKEGLDERQPFPVLGLCLDATTTQLNQLILTNVLGFRRGRSGSHGSSHGGLDACELFPECIAKGPPF